MKKNLIYGRNPVREALLEGGKIDKVFLQNGITKEFADDIKQMCRDQVIPMKFVPSVKLDKLCNGEHQGIMAFTSQVMYYKTEDVIPHLYEQGKTPLILILDGLTDVRNFGAIARTAYCSGVDAIIIPADGSVTVTPDAIKTSAGALRKMMICRELILAKTAEFLQMSGLQVICADGGGSDMIGDLDLTIPVAIVMGSEDKGPSRVMLRIADRMAKLPVVNRFDSYNVSVATGMFLYEIMTQRLKQN